MRLKKYQTDEERGLLTAMVVNDAVLGRIALQIRGDKKPFRSRWSNLVANWCLDHYAKFQEAPRESIQAIFRGYAESSKDEDELSIVEEFITGLSSDYEAAGKEINESFVLDRASEYLNRVRMERLLRRIEADLEANDVSSAENQLATFAPVSIGTTDIIDVFNDEDAWNQALSQESQEALIHYPGSLGEFFGDHMARDCFVAFLAPEKRGKSFWLIDAAWRASVLGKKRTLLYSVGDMTEPQMMRRILTRAARRPVKPCSFSWPRQMRLREGTVQLRKENREYKDPLTFSEVKSAMCKIRMKTAHSKNTLLKLRCTPTDTTTVADITADVEGLARLGWIADVIVIDYADILAPEIGTGGQDTRDKINTTWKALRRLSQQRHCLVVTATQSDAASYDAGVMRKKHFSEDKRKHAHVTAMAGINQTEEEKEQGIYRLNWVDLREGFFKESRCVTVAGCLELANPAILSAF